MSPEKELKQLLKETGAELIRSKKHQIYRLPNGKNFVMASTRSDKRSIKNDISDLRKVASMKRER